MPRSEQLYLTDMLEAAEAVQRYIGDRTRDDFLGDEILRDAVLRRLTVIEEAAARLSVPFRQRHADVDWSEIAAFRNFAVHAYFAVNWRIVWGTAHRNVPELRRRLAEILGAEYPTSDETGI